MASQFFQRSTFQKTPRTRIPASPSITTTTPVNIFDAKFLFASLIWGSIGVGYIIYAKKQQEIVPFIGGLVMIAVSYFVSSALLMSLISVAVIVTVHLLLRRG